MLLNKKIIIYTSTPVPDGSGGFTDAWDSGRTAWADIDITNSGKLFFGSQEYNGTYYTLTLRTITLNYVPPIENYKILINAFGVTHTLKITSVKPQDLKSWFTIIQCVESNG